MLDAAWMHRDERPLGTRLSDMKAHAEHCRREAVRMEREASRLRNEANETERQIENLRRAHS
ncbi:MAG TPA: hypothetical protein VFB45_15335 [Pseudolabrys sp.]|nr:hypothetical protein [Pseudolabrys sp.]